MRLTHVKVKLKVGGRIKTGFRCDSDKRLHDWLLDLTWWPLLFLTLSNPSLYLLAFCPKRSVPTLSLSLFLSTARGVSICDIKRESEWGRGFIFLFLFVLGPLLPFFSSRGPPQIKAKQQKCTSWKGGGGKLPLFIVVCLGCKKGGN